MGGELGVVSPSSDRHLNVDSRRSSGWEVR